MNDVDREVDSSGRVASTEFLNRLLDSCEAEDIKKVCKEMANERLREYDLTLREIAGRAALLLGRIV